MIRPFTVTPRQGRGLDQLDEIRVGQVIHVILVGRIVRVGAAHEDIRNISGVELRLQKRHVVSLVHGDVQGVPRLRLVGLGHVIVLVGELGAVEEHFEGLALADDKRGAHDDERRSQKISLHSFLLFEVYSRAVCPDMMYVYHMTLALSTRKLME